MALVDKYDGIFGGCWSTWFHDDTPVARNKEMGACDMFARAGFEYLRKLGTKRCVMHKTVSASR